MTAYLADATGTGTGDTGTLVSILPPAFNLSIPYIAATDTSALDGANLNLTLAFDNTFNLDPFKLYDSGPGVTGNYVISSNTGESIMVEGHKVSGSLGGSTIALPGWDGAAEVTIKYCGDESWHPWIGAVQGAVPEVASSRLTVDDYTIDVSDGSNYVRTGLNYGLPILGEAAFKSEYFDEMIGAILTVRMPRPQEGYSFGIVTDYDSDVPFKLAADGFTITDFNGQALANFLQVDDRVTITFTTESGASLINNIAENITINTTEANPETFQVHYWTLVDTAGRGVYFECSQFKGYGDSPTAVSLEEGDPVVAEQLPAYDWSGM